MDCKPEAPKLSLEHLVEHLSGADASLIDEWAAMIAELTRARVERCREMARRPPRAAPRWHCRLLDDAPYGRIPDDKEPCEFGSKLVVVRTLSNYTVYPLMLLRLAPSFGKQRSNIEIRGGKGSHKRSDGSKRRTAPVPTLPLPQGSLRLHCYSNL